MVKTQVQLPDHLYREGKRIAAEYEMSFADVVRRGLERVIPSFPPRRSGGREWALPSLDLGLTADPFADPDWRERLHDDGAPRRRRRTT
jgi:hypothetical protein